MRKFFNAWLLGTVALYYFGPIDWPGRSEPWIALFVLANLAAFNIGYRSLRNPEMRRYSDFDLLGVMGSRYFAIAVMLTYGLLSIIYMRLTTGQTLGSIFSGGMRLETIYNDYQLFLSERGNLSLANQLISLLKASIFPVALVLLAKNFRESWLVVAAFIVPMIAFSLARGTDKETVDIALILSVLSIYYGMANRVRIFLLATIPILIYLFVIRRYGRFGGFLPECLPGSIVCFNFDSPLAQVSPLLEVAFILGTNYLTQGYEALHIAFSLDLQFNFGLGHLPPVQRVVCGIIGLGCDLGNYNEALADAGWDTRNRWSSVYVFLANDLTWYLVPIYFYFIGWSLRFAESEWYRRRHSGALAVIVLIAVFTLYSPANMQIAINLDWACATIFLLYGHALTMRTKTYLVSGRPRA